MTDHDFDHTDPGDYRRAAVVVLHHRRGNTEGLTAVIDETNDLDRAAHLLYATLGLHHAFIARLRTRDGINLLADWVHGMAGLDAAEDVCRAARILEHHGRQDNDGIVREMEAAITDSRATETFVQLLDLYEVALPELSSPAGIKWIEEHITALAGEETR